MAEFLFEIGNEIGIPEIQKLRREITKIGLEDQLKLVFQREVEEQKSLVLEVLREHQFSYNSRNEENIITAKRKGR